MRVCPSSYDRRVAISSAQKAALREWVTSKACAEFRNGKPCVQRGSTTMAGDMHEPCDRVVEILDIVDQI
ncbi:MAG: hypothetical protein JWM89_572 [Acidimicrobiales bacterium]|nr:hypothetical protein [Acidimicrobiales bacterium]